jgi:hypothetical protein
LRDYIVDGTSTAFFKSEPDGHVLWTGTRDYLEAAKAFVCQYGHSKPGEYLICSLKTNNRISMTVPEENLKGRLTSLMAGVSSCWAVFEILRLEKLAYRLRRAGPSQSSMQRTDNWKRKANSVAILILFKQLSWWGWGGSNSRPKV